MAIETSLRQTPFHSFHAEHGAKLVEYTGWEMPLHYGSIIDEHRQVRSSGGMFDVSHMGRLRFSGRDARNFLDRVCTQKINGMQPGKIRYTLICNEQGGCKDDVLVYCVGESEYLCVCNAANREKLIAHFAAVKDEMVFKLKDETESTAMVAVQGPKVMELIGQFSKEIPELKRYCFTNKSILIAKFLVSRTGYTGEDGVEVILPKMVAKQMIKMLLGNVDAEDTTVKPCGLGARDSLRLEAGMALYGHEITEDIDPLTAGLHFAVKLDKGVDDTDTGGFIGQEALQAIAASGGPKQKLTGLILEGRRAARQGMAVLRDGRPIGTITSGCFSPTLEKSIAMAILDIDARPPGTSLEVDLGRAAVSAKTTPLPFYKA
ncbi:MAG: glycine cleavage system aminomethyltransferase GcvT [Phycisphaerales bacterium]|jgi:aminomethyltransferase|nr:glycine cleavage system aminomethyltransferase GcvT [Phycisphaerales bacterium]